MPYNYARGRFLEKRRKSDKVRKLDIDAAIVLGV